MKTAVYIINEWIFFIVCTRTIGQMSYGFALPKGSPYRVLINIELLKMQQKGIIKKLIKKWMIDKTPCPPLDDANNLEEGTVYIHTAIITSCC